MINSLFLTNLYEDREVPEAAVKAGQTVSIEASTVEIEERGVKELIQIFCFKFFRTCLETSGALPPTRIPTQKFKN